MGSMRDSAHLVARMVARELRARTRGSVLGLAWLVLTPLLMLLVYTLVLRHVLGVRWGAAGASGLSDAAFALRLYAGLAVFAFFSECAVRAPRLVLEVPHLVKKVVFPLELLAWVSVGAALVPLAVAGVLLLLGQAAVGAGLSLSVLALPLVWLPLVPLGLALGWWLSALGTYVRDVGEVVGLAVGALLFLCPVFYDASSLPAALQPWLGWNPLALVMTQTREVLLDGLWPSWGPWAAVMGASVALALAGRWVFERVRPGFADVV